MVTNEKQKKIDQLLDVFSKPVKVGLIIDHSTKLANIDGPCNKQM